jgi:hypothetical protein
MQRRSVELAEVIRDAGPTFTFRNHPWLTWLHLKVLVAILRCRTALLGGHVDACSRCGHQAISYNSCLMGSFLFWGVRPTNQRCSGFGWTLHLPIRNRVLLLPSCVPSPFKS